MTNTSLKQYLKNHHIDDAILNDFIDRKLYNTAIGEIPRVVHSLELKIYALQSLENMIDSVSEKESNLKNADVII